MAEPGFFLQTLTNTFVDWVFGRLDTYIEDKPNESDEPLDKKSNRNLSSFRSETVGFTIIFIIGLLVLPFFTMRCCSTVFGQRYVQLFLAERVDGPFIRRRLLTG